MGKISIEDSVKEILNSYDITEIPVEPLKITRNQNIGVYKVEFDAYNGDVVSGALHKENDKFEILINMNDSILRQRFTIAHELGHYFIHLKDCKECEWVDMHRTTGFNTSIPNEEEANQFAAALLMPKDCLIEQFNKVKSLGFNKQYIIQLLADTFVVSKPAVEYRLKNLNFNI